MGKLQVWMHYATGTTMEMSGDMRSQYGSLMSEAAAHFVHYDLSDINLMKTCSRQSVPSTGRGGWGVDVGPKIVFLPWSHVFLFTPVVHCATDLPKLAWQDPPTGARDNGTEALSTNGTLTKCSDQGARPVEIASELLLCIAGQLYSQQGLIWSWQTFMRDVRSGCEC